MRSIEPVYWTIDLRPIEHRERLRVIALLVAFEIVPLPAANHQILSASVRLATIWTAPSYVPFWLQSFWTLTGFTTGLEICLGVWWVSQLARWAEVRRLLTASERGGQLPVPPPPPGLVPPP